MPLVDIITSGRPHISVQRVNRPPPVILTNDSDMSPFFGSGDEDRLRGVWDRVNTTLPADYLQAVSDITLGRTDDANVRTLVPIPLWAEDAPRNYRHVFQGNRRTMQALRWWTEASLRLTPAMERMLCKYAPSVLFDPLNVFLLEMSRLCFGKVWLYGEDMLAVLMPYPLDTHPVHTRSSELVMWHAHIVPKLRRWQQVEQQRCQQQLRELQGMYDEQGRKPVDVRRRRAGCHESESQ